MVKRLPCHIVLVALVLCTAAVAQGPPSTNFDESKVGSYTLPDPLAFNDGQRVLSASEWMERRRPQILKVFEEDVYGRSPHPPKTLRYKVFDKDKKALGGEAIRKQVAIRLTRKKRGPVEDLLIYIPAGAPRPVPMILTLNFSGNQAVIDDPGIKLPMLWDRNTGTRERAPESSRGSDPNFEVRKVLARGYALGTIYYQQIDPDFKGGYKDGIRPLFLAPGEMEPAADEWGAIGAWAYGLSRAMDYLEKDKDIDARRVAVMGHSRLGKTALWAGALDTRFAMVIANCSGEGGASLMRRNYGETIRNLIEVFPYWFDTNFQKYAGHADLLPVDAHELIALIAPRPVYVTAAEDDQWADPRGEFLACVAAGPVYRLLGAQDLGTDQMPPLNQPILHTIAYHIRTGKHAVTSFDWDQFLAFADLHFRARQ